MREIDKQALLHNIDEMINALEYDSMRSGGKCKINSGTLVNLYNLRGIYDAATKAAPKPKSTK